MHWFDLPQELRLLMYAKARKQLIKDTLNQHLMRKAPIITDCGWPRVTLKINWDKQMEFKWYLAWCRYCIYNVRCIEYHGDIILRQAQGVSW